MGEVKKPGAMAMNRPVNLVSAIAMAGGFTDAADDAAILVMRLRPNNDYDYWTLDLKRGLLAPEQQGGFALRSNDVVYVARSPIANANLFVQQYIRGLLPFDLGIGYAIQVR
jgi:polysaccharide export outer membrane protein